MFEIKLFIRVSCPVSQPKTTHPENNTRTISESNITSWLSLLTHIILVCRRTWEREGRPKLSLRRFFSAMGLNSMGKMVKGCRSSSMEQLSLSSARASPSPSHKGHTLLQRTPSLQALHTVSRTNYQAAGNLSKTTDTLRTRIALLFIYFH